MVGLGWRRGPPINFRLEPGADQVWRIEKPEGLREMLTRDRHERPLCRFVAVLATGRSVTSNEIRIHHEETEGFEIRLVNIDEIHADDQDQ